MQNELSSEERGVQGVVGEQNKARWNSAQRVALLPRASGEQVMLRRWLAAASLIAVLCPVAPSQTTHSTKPDPSPLSVPPRTWAVDAAANELTALHHPGSYLRYRMHIVDAKGDMTRDLIESQDGPVARLIQRNGKPLTDEQDKAERLRLNDMIAHPSAFSRHVKDEESGRKIADELLRLMPDAMVFTYVPGQPQIPGSKGTQVVLDYVPNPKFKAPTITAEALAGLKGRGWIDAKSHRIVRMEGTIFRPVNLGWGLVAHIYPGGTLLLQQADAGGGRWIFTHFTEDISVRALLVKTIKVHEQVDAFDFEILPGPMKYQDAIRVLLDTPLTSR